MKCSKESFDLICWSLKFIRATSAVLRLEGSDGLLQRPAAKPLLGWRCARAGGSSWLLLYGLSLDDPTHSEEFACTVVVSLLCSFSGKSPVKQGGTF